LKKRWIRDTILPLLGEWSLLNPAGLRQSFIEVNPEGAGSKVPPPKRKEQKMPRIELWPREALGPKARPDCFEVTLEEALQIRERLPQGDYLCFKDVKGHTYGVYLKNYRYVLLSRPTRADLPADLSPSAE
jgi:hypothetical protein